MRRMNKSRKQRTIHSRIPSADRAFRSGGQLAFAKATRRRIVIIARALPGPHWRRCYLPASIISGGNALFIDGCASSNRAASAKCFVSSESKFKRLSIGPVIGGFGWCRVWPFLSYSELSARCRSSPRLMSGFSASRYSGCGYGARRSVQSELGEGRVGHSFRAKMQFCV